MNCGRTHHGRWLVVLMILGTVALGSALWRGVVGQDASPVGDPNGLAKAEGLSRAFRAAAKQVIPTVVKVTSTTESRVIERERGDTLRENPFKGTPFEEFFDDHDLHDRGFRYQVPPRQGLGSGVIIDPKGIVLTNNHVVAGADKVMVELADGREFEAVEIKTDELTDLAVVKIDVKTPLPAAALGDSKNLEIGDWVLAIGNPFDMDHTVSAGIISGKGRSLRVGKRTEFLQTDAAINPGNSGGPLVNLNGEVVGINTAIASNTGVYQGIGFAIPVNLAKWVSNQLVKSGSVRRAYLGVHITDADGELGQRLGVSRLDGVLVAAVYRDSPAAAAGFKVGDVILAFAGQPVHSARELQEIVERSPIGSRQKADIIRNGKRTTLHVVVKSLPDDLVAGMAPPRLRGGDGRSGFVSRKLGLQVDEVTEEAAKQFGLEEASGVLISRVDPRGMAYGAGLRRGMLILEVEKKPVKSVADFEAALKDLALSKGVLLKLRTEDGVQYVLLQRS